MPNLNAILSSGTPIDEAHRAALAWRRISEKPTSITIKRGAVTLDAQTMRVELSETSTTQRGNAGSGTMRDVVLFGVRNHPDALIEDTDVQAKDRFVLNNVEYQIMDVVLTLGEVQARCEAVS